MQEPTPHSSRLVMAGGLAALLLAGGAGFVMGRTTASERVPPVAAAPLPQPAPKASSAPMVPQPTLERAGLLDLVAEAVDAASASRGLPATVQDAAGRRFDLVLPFGCEGPAEGERKASFGWQYDKGATTLRVWINPLRWDRTPWAATEAGEDQSALEGFWIAKPWSSATACPATALSGAPAPVSSLQTQDELAIARVLRVDADKSARRLDIVKRMEPDGFDPRRGFALRITGRLRSAGAGGPIRCLQRAGQNQRPQCMIIGDFTELRVENPKTGDLLGVWPISESSPRD